jgi:hypothetical protein
MVREGFPKRWATSLIIPIFKRGEKNNFGNYITIMISPIFAKLIG